MWLLSVAACLAPRSFPVEVDLVEGVPLGAATELSLPFELSLYDERPSAYLPAFLDTEGFGAVLLADAALRAEGLEGPLGVGVEGPEWAPPEPLTLTVTISSRDGVRYLAGPGAAEVVAPAACTFDVASDTNAEVHAAQVLGCLRAWVDANGAPRDPFVEVAGTTAAADWSFQATWTFGTDRPVDTACTGPRVVDGELPDEADDVDLSDLRLAGYAAAADGPMVLVAFENTWVAEGPVPGAGAIAVASMGGAEGVFLGEPVEVIDPIPASVGFRADPAPITTWPASWNPDSLAALRSPDGWVDACRVAVHEVAPNEAWVRVVLVGEGVLIR